MYDAPPVESGKGPAPSSPTQQVLGSLELVLLVNLYSAFAVVFMLRELLHNDTSLLGDADLEDEVTSLHMLALDNEEAPLSAITL